VTAELAGVAVALLLALATAVASTDRLWTRRRFARRQPGPLLGAPGLSQGTRREYGYEQASAGAELDDTAMMLELVGATLEAGSGLGRALELIAGLAAQEFRAALRPVVSALAIGADWDAAWRSSTIRSPQLLDLRDALGFAALTGAPSSALLYAQAARIRRERFRMAEKQAAALGVKLVVPLGLCSLPAFVCLGIVPVLLAMVPG
jgi:hypothetical protein